MLNQILPAEFSASKALGLSRLAVHHENWHFGHFRPRVQNSTWFKVPPSGNAGGCKRPYTAASSHMKEDSLMMAKTQ